MENKDIKTIIDQLADDIIANIKSNIASYGLADGNLYNSFESNIEGNHLQILGANYFDYAEKGRGPGGVPVNFTAILTEWVSRRNIRVDDTWKFVNNVKWKTIREGSYLYRHPDQQRDFLKDVFEEPFAKFQDSFDILLEEQIKNQ